MKLLEDEFPDLLLAIPTADAMRVAALLEAISERSPELVEPAFARRVKHFIISHSLPLERGQAHLVVREMTQARDKALLDALDHAGDGGKPN